MYSLKFAVLKNSTAGVSYKVGEEVSGAKNREDRVQLDWITKF